MTDWLGVCPERRKETDMKQGTKDQEPTAPTRNHHGCCADKACTEATCMELPPGKKCGDCVHAYRCCLMFGHGNMDTYCDWFPRRFHEKTSNDQHNRPASAGPG